MSKKWYVVQTYSGYENSVKQDLDRRIENMDMKDKIYQVLIPEEEQEQTKKDGSKTKKLVKMFPGYIFVEMEVDKEVDEKAWFMVRNTPKVTGFLGSSGGGTKPISVPNEQINEILRKIGKLERVVLNINVGDKVTITATSFAGLIGEISKIDEDKDIVTVLVELFGGRSTPMDFQINQVKKIEN